VFFAPLEARWAQTPESTAVSAVKISAIKILAEVANLRSNFRVAKLLAQVRERSASVCKGPVDHARVACAGKFFACWLNHHSKELVR
jgi:hypothetical protein